MICPNCGDEYRDGFTQCAECHVPLVKNLPEASPKLPNANLVTVYRGSAASLPVVESVLRGAGIEFLSKSSGVQDLFGGGRIGLGYNALVGPVEVQVTADEEEASRALLKEIGSPSGEPGP